MNRGVIIFYNILNLHIVDILAWNNCVMWLEQHLMLRHVSVSFTSIYTVEKSKKLRDLMVRL